MTTFQPNFEVHSTLKPGGLLELAIVEAQVPVPAEPDAVIVEMRAAPINPSDIRSMLGPADPISARSAGTPGRPKTVLDLEEDRFGDVAARLNRSLSLGVEGAGVVVDAGSSPQARALVGHVVAIMGGGMYSRYRKVQVEQCLVIPEGIAPAEAASCYINPLTVLGMVETMRADGFAGLAHTVAASNLGQMLNKVCIEEGIPLVNIVRSSAQAELLRGAGAAFVCDRSAEGFSTELVSALRASGVKLAFDATGGGELAGALFAAMEAAHADPSSLRTYAAEVRKQVYIYGGLEPGPTVVHRTFGTSWTLGGWSLFSFLGKVSPSRLAELELRVVDGLRTTFASRFSEVISPRQLLDPETIRAYARRATGRKYLVDPSLGY